MCGGGGGYNLYLYHSSIHVSRSVSNSVPDIWWVRTKGRFLPAGRFLLWNHTLFLRTRVLLQVQPFEIFTQFIWWSTNIQEVLCNVRMTFLMKFQHRLLDADSPPNPKCFGCGRYWCWYTLYAYLLYSLYWSLISNSFTTVHSYFPVDIST